MTINMSKGNRYSLKFIYQILRSLQSNEFNIKETARQENINHSTLRKWYKKYGKEVLGMDPLEIRAKDIKFFPEPPEVLNLPMAAKIDQEIEEMKEKLLLKMRTTLSRPTNIKHLAESLKIIFDISRQQSIPTDKGGPSDPEEFGKLIISRLEKIEFKPQKPIDNATTED